MAFLIYDEKLAADARAEFEARYPDRPYEVWEGDVVVSPSANNEHNTLQARLIATLSAQIDWDAGDEVSAPCNVSDRGAGEWEENYRNPDIAVFLAASRAVNHDTFWEGGPDLAVEILSPREPAHAKLPFYAAAGTRELLIVFRNPWRLELWRLVDGVMQLAASVGFADPPAASAVLPVTFGLRHVARRPEVVVTHTVTGQVWAA